MTVKELITELNKHDPNMDVLIGTEDINEIDEATLIGECEDALKVVVII